MGFLKELIQPGKNSDKGILTKLLESNITKVIVSVVLSTFIGVAIQKLLEINLQVSFVTFVVSFVLIVIMLILFKYHKWKKQKLFDKKLIKQISLLKHLPSIDCNVLFLTFLQSHKYSRKHISLLAIKIAIIVIMIIPISAILVSSYQYFLPVYYYDDVVEVYGLPRGIGDELSKNERLTSFDYWEIRENKLNKTYTLSLVTSSGVPMELIRDNSTLYSLDYFQKPARIVYWYKDDGGGNPIITRAEYQRSDGKKLIELKYDTKAQFKVTTFVDSNGTALFNSRIYKVVDSDYRSIQAPAMLQVEYDDNGYVAKRRIIAQTGVTGIYNTEGIAGEIFVCNKDGRIESICFLDEDGQLARDSSGIAGVKFSYGAGQLDEVKYFEDFKLSMPIDGQNGAHAERFTYDKRNLFERSFLSVDGESVGDINGVNYYAYTYQGEALDQERYLDSAKQPVFIPDYWGTNRKYGADGRKREFSVLEETTRITEDLKTLAANELNSYFYDDEATGQSEVMSSVSYGENQAQPTLSKRASTAQASTGEQGSQNVSNRTTIIYRFNSTMRIIGVRHCDEFGNPTHSRSGYSSKKMSYNAVGNLIKEEYFSVSGKAYYVNGGYAAVRYVYGSNGEISEVQYLDAHSNLTIRHDKRYALKQMEYRPDENLIRERYKTADYQEAVNDEWYGCLVRGFDEFGRVIIERYQLDDDFALNNNGYAGINYSYDPESNTNRPSEIKYVGKNLEPITHRQTGYAVVRREYDERGNISEERYCGAGSYNNSEDEQLVLRKDGGYAVTRSVYDERGSRVEQSYFGTDGITPVPRTDGGYAVYRAEFDERGRYAGWSYFGTDGTTPVLHSGYGYARVEQEYDERGNLVEERYFGTDGKQLVLRTDRGYAVICLEYDERGNLVEERYFGIDGEPIPRKPDGYARICWEYGERGNVIRWWCYDAAGNLLSQSQ
jgi:hypothetical protein